MFISNRVLGGALLAFALIGSQVARADDEKAVNLIVAPKAGRVTRTQSIIKTSVMGMDLLITQTQKDTIKEVKDNGDFVTEIADEGSVVNIGGQEQNQPAVAPRTITRDKFGKVKEVKADEVGTFMAPEVARIMTSLSTSILTDKAVKTKDTWQTELDNPAVKEKKITVKDTYLGLDKIDGKDYWKIKQTAEAIVDADGNKLSYEITEWLNPEDGNTVKVEGTIKDVPTQVGPLTMQITSKALKADDKGKAAPAKP
ncbi:MAG: hypothetical protein JWL77_2540 [Chthonomonadaceae bacterium]|nr:hypothetical protein [Chthonomonadaceae bacterium]